MARVSLLIVAVLLASAACAQTPEIALFADLRPSLTSSEGENATLRWYDPLGRHSVVGFRVILEPGLRGKVSQRLQRIDGDPDEDLIDELYLERRGEWRVGKQYLPFGDGVLLRESAPAVRYDTRIVIDEAPIQLAYVDAGGGKTRGFVGRVGRRLGLSFAVGNHFGIGAGTLATVRSALEAPGRYRGYGLVLGADAEVPLGDGLLEAEFAQFRNGETAADETISASELRWSLMPRGRRERYEIAWSRNWSQPRNLFRFELEIPLEERLTLAPMVRFADGSWHDLSVTARVRF